jgi:NitT/TauT family transport system ATP-binding protein
MDEPFGALDAPTRAQMQLLLVEVLADTRATVVFVTHDVDEALFLGDRVALLGTSGASGPGPQLLGVPQPRDREAASRDATAALRRTVLDALSASSSARS